MYEIRHYLTVDEKDVYLEWLRKLRDTTARMYYAIAGMEIVLLLCGGDKRTQDGDIDRVCDYWQDWQRRTSDER
jgi:putative component of toxin-antitoxin plasmid stabilization module